VKALQQQGLGQRAIARQLQLHRRTVRRYMLAETFPERALGRQSISTVQPYLPYVPQRWGEGCHDRQQLWQELVAQGYTGSYASVCRAVARQPTCAGTTASATSTVPKVRSLSSRQAAWALLRRPEDATDEEEKKRQLLCTLCPDAATAYPLAQRFGQMIRGRQVEELDAWLAEAEASDVPELRSFAMGLRRDYAAVRAALELPWSTGPVEGQINRVKMLKRQTYGRAKFDLLRRRVLLA
jgi:transposase